MFTQEKLKKLHRILTSKISRASKKLSLNLKIKKARDISYNNKKNMIIKSNSVKGKKKKINQNKKNVKKQKNFMDKTFQNNISVLSEIKKKEENFNESFASYLTDSNFIHKNKIKNVTIIKNHNKEFYDKSLLYHVMKYYITKSNNSSIKFDHLYYIFKPMTNYIHNSKNKKFNQSMNEKRNYLYYDDNFNLTFGKSKNNNQNFEVNEPKTNYIKSNKIKNLNLMNNQIFNNNFIFNINNYRSNINSTKNNKYKDIINEENTPSFNNENKEQEFKSSNKKIKQKKLNLSKNYINIEELKLNNHILQNLIHKKKALDNSKNKLSNKSKSKKPGTPRIQSINKKLNLVEEINKRMKNKYSKNKDINHK